MHHTFGGSAFNHRDGTENTETHRGNGERGRGGGESTDDTDLHKTPLFLVVSVRLGVLCASVVDKAAENVMHPVERDRLYFDVCFPDNAADV